MYLFLQYSGRVWAGSLARIGHKPPKLSSIEWNEFKDYLFKKYNDNWAYLTYRYALRYHHLLENPSRLETFKESKKNNVLKALITVAKYCGIYESFKENLKNHGIKWGRVDSLNSFLRMFNTNNEAIEWLKQATDLLPTNEALYLEFALISGLRRTESINAFNLIIDLSMKGILGNYYNEELNALEHFKFKKLFLRRTKNCFISFVPKELIESIEKSTPITYENIRKKLQRRHIKTKIDQLRDYWATFMARNGLIREEVDLLQGRVPPSIFVRHYWSPSFKDLRDRTVKAISTLKEANGLFP